MPRIHLEIDGLHLTVEPELGGAISEFWLQREEPIALLRPTSPSASWFNDMACYLLAPWSNRIKDARFQWCGREIQLEPDWRDGTAIHGLVKTRPFRVVDRSPLSIRLRRVHAPTSVRDWPWNFVCDAGYEITPRGLRARLVVTNTSANDQPMPSGLGFHPFFPRTMGPPDRVAIQYGSRGRYPADAMIPTGPARHDDASLALASGAPLGHAALDDVFLGSTDGAEITWPARGVRLRYSCSPTLTHGVVYTGAPDGSGTMPSSFCFEPVSMVNDGFNLHSRGWEGTGVAALRPGESQEARWEIEVLA